MNPKPTCLQYHAPNSFDNKINSIYACEKSYLHVSVIKTKELIISSPLTLAITKQLKQEIALNTLEKHWIINLGSSKISQTFRRRATKDYQPSINLKDFRVRVRGCPISPTVMVPGQYSTHLSVFHLLP